MPLQFDYNGAKAAGYNDDQIADILGQKVGFNTAGARAAGYQSTDIITKLIGAPTQTPQIKPPVEDPGVMGSMLIGAGRTFDRVGKGVQQMYHGAMGNDAELAQLKTQAENDDAAYKPLQDLHPFATGVGEALPSMAVPIGGTGTALATAGKLAASAAVPAALEYGTVEERAKKAAGDAAGAVVGGVLVPKVAGLAWQGGKNALRGMAGNITPEAAALAAKAEQLGIPVNAAQLGDSKFLKTLNSAIEQMPFTGGAKTAAKQHTDFTRAVSKTFGDDVEKITPEVYARNRTRLGQQFDELSMQNTARIDDAVMTRLDGILDEARQFGNDDTVKAVDNIITRILKQSNASADMTGGKVGANTVIELPGAAYSSLDTQLGKLIKNGGEKGNFARELQKTLRDAMDQSVSPETKAAWTQARTEYKNLKAVRDIVSKDGGNGDIPPGMLMNALNNSEAGKEAMALGSRGVLGDLGQIGKSFVRDTVPNSGTAQRAMAMGLVGGGGIAFGAEPSQVAGMLVGGATAGRLLNKVMNNPKVIASLSQQGIKLSDLANMAPDKLTQVLGGLLGMTAVEDMRN